MKRGYRVVAFAFVACVIASTLQKAYAADNSSPEEVKKSFAVLRQAVLSGNNEKIISQLSPDTMALFSECCKLAVTPDTTNLLSLSQFEIIVGFQAYWQLSRYAAYSMSATNIFEWACQQRLVNLRGIVNVELTDIDIKGSRATARVKDGTSAETRVAFDWSDGKWKLNLKEILLLPEQQLAEIRNRENLSKAQMAVLILERIHQKPIQALRELLISPQVRQMIVQLKGKDSSCVYDRVIAELGAGRQCEAEEVLDIFVAVHTNDQRLAFAQAVCSRSRFATSRADAQFMRVLEINPVTLEGNCARYVLDLDARKKVRENMNSLRLLIKNNPDNPLLLWVMAVECRENYKLTEETTYSREAEQCYRQLLGIFKVGPVLLHQTFANVLSEELNQNEEALAHRRIAVALEPESWTYQGLANTLSLMKRYAEANEAYAKLIELDPHDARYWLNWAGSLSRQNLYDESIEKYKKAIECDPACFEAYNYWGFCLEEQRKYTEALEKYEKAKALNPADRYAYGACARVLALQGRKAEARSVRTQQDMVPTKHTGFVSTNLTDATRPTFLGQIKGADLQTLSLVFGKPAFSAALGSSATEYTILKWHNWGQITLRLDQEEGLETIIACNYKDGKASLAEWRDALWRDFGVKIDHIRITKKNDPYNVHYEAECLDSAQGVKWIGFCVASNQVRDLNGSTTDALTDWGFVSSQFMILFWSKPGEFIGL